CGYLPIGYLPTGYLPIGALPTGGAGGGGSLRGRSAAAAALSMAKDAAVRDLSFPKILSSADSRDEAESAHHPARCLPPSICLGRLSPTYSSRNAGLKSRISFSAISSKLL